MKRAIITDSSSTITPELASELGIYTIPMEIIVDSQEYEEFVTIDTNTFMNYLENGSIVKTSQPAVGKLIELVEKLLEEYDEVIHISLSSKLSGTYQTAKLLESNFDNRYKVIDSLRFSISQKQIVLDVIEMIKQNYTLEQITHTIETSIKDERIYILADTLTYLSRGGRISPSIAAVGNLLKIKPVLVFKDGEISLKDKVRTLHKGYLKCIEDMQEIIEPNQEYIITILYYHNQEQALEVKELLNTNFPNIEVNLELLTPIVMAHTGPDGVGIAFRKKLI